ncbi:hypothetical protein C8R42DRAFT_572308 [Lentinula raphanica]|nr:hypothetical protein C8R42DRAFT_572308 [Lentinula raphanica]
MNSFVHRRKHQADAESEWYPWPDRETYVLDVLRHVPRCAFSRKQNLAIHWVMMALGIGNLPSDRAMDDIDVFLQKLCGIQSIRYVGKFGHVYYVNDLAGIIRQEMANPQVRGKLHFYPEDAGSKLCQAWQGDRWKSEMDPHLLTPMVRLLGQDFYTFEPCLLDDGRVCMPVRWFERRGELWGTVWMMKVAESGRGPSGLGWAVQSWQSAEIHYSKLLSSFPQLQRIHDSQGLPSPQHIIGKLYPSLTIEEVSPNEVIDWTHTDPQEGNRWRCRSQGKRVLAFPIWLYCDDTSGNVSKKWNKHNSFLFTAAGLPRQYVHQESNIHFLCTSNTAPPLEMLDGIVEQLELGFDNGIWAWDCQSKEMVLLIPSVLAMLGDNPMQSELACHIGFRGKLFCRVCWVRGHPEEEPDSGEGDAAGEDTDRMSVASSAGSTGKKKKGTVESMADMLARVKQFMTVRLLKSTPRNKAETCENLRSQFAMASKIGGMAAYKREKTATGVKDTYLEGFVNQMAAITTRKGRDIAQRERDLNELKASFPADVTSPVWRIKGLDPHCDTPVEILHVILLGFVKYFWRDAVARTKKQSDILIAQLSSFNTSGLGISRLAGPTLVNYAGSLTGRDFRAIAQAAPFVLQGLISEDQMSVWHALSRVVALVWQPEIHDREVYLDELEQAIDHFLTCTCRLTPRWFNKPKFHVILHLPNHIRRFGPAMLFATEGFESFNAIIRACSVHSNRHAPSKDVAHRMARGNRIRHLMKGGYIARPQSTASVLNAANASTVTANDWVSVSTSVLSMAKILDFGGQLLGLEEDGEETLVAGGFNYVHMSASRLNPITQTKTAGYVSGTVLGSGPFRTCEGFVAQSGDICYEGSWIACMQESARPRVGRVIEVLQVPSTYLEIRDKADYVTIQWAITGEIHPQYHMRRLGLVDECIVIPAKNVLSAVNVQHNCVDCKCPVTRNATQMLEREIVKEKSLAVEHHAPHSDLILNTAQMRSAAYLMALRPPIVVLDQSKVIQDAVRAEVDLRKKTQGKKAANALSIQKQPVSSRVPQPTPLSIPGPSFTTLMPQQISNRPGPSTGMSYSPMSEPSAFYDHRRDNRSEAMMADSSGTRSSPSHFPHLQTPRASHQTLFEHQSFTRRDNV